MSSWLLGVSFCFFSSVSVYNGFGLRNKLRDGPLHNNEKARGIFFSPNGVVAPLMTGYQTVSPIAVKASRVIVPGRLQEIPRRVQATCRQEPTPGAPRGQLRHSIRHFKCAEDMQPARHKLIDLRSLFPTMEAGTVSKDCPLAKAIGCPLQKRVGKRRKLEKNSADPLSSH